MKLTIAQYHQKIKHETLPDIVWISGDEPLQCLEAQDAFRARARQDGFNVRTIIEVDRRFDGAGLIAANQSMSLFGEQELIELRLHSKLNDKGRKALLEYAQHLHADRRLLITSERLEAAQIKAKWFRQIESLGWWLPIWPIESNQLPAWIRARFTALGIDISSDAIGLLCERVEGNLLAAKQEIEKIRLVLGDHKKIHVEDVLAMVAESSRYSVFDLSKALLNAELSQSLKIVHSLVAEGVEFPIILWLLTKELRIIIELAECPLDKRKACFQNLRVLERNQNRYINALKRADKTHYIHCLMVCAQADAVLKGQQQGNVNDLLIQIIQLIAQPNMPSLLR